jgi:hypothetical protein
VYPTEVKIIKNTNTIFFNCFVGNIYDKTTAIVHPMLTAIIIFNPIAKIITIKLYNDNPFTNTKDKTNGSKIIITIQEEYTTANKNLKIKILDKFNGKEQKNCKSSILYKVDKDTVKDEKINITKLAKNAIPKIRIVNKLPIIGKVEI